MANEEHLEILKQGVEVWNQWRKENPETQPDLAGVELGHLAVSYEDPDFRHVVESLTAEEDFSQVVLSYGAMDLRRADLRDANLRGANLRWAVLNGANLRKTDLSGAEIHEGFLNCADLRSADLSRANLSEVDLNRANLREANLSLANLFFAELSGSNLVRAKLVKADLYHTFFEEAKLSDADLSNADLRLADLTNADLVGATLVYANLGEANLSGADLTETDLHNANLSKTNLNGAILRESKMGWTNFGDIDLGAVIGLNTVKHHRPSFIDIHTIYRSKGKIPELFLRGAGVPDSMIEFARSLVSSEQVIDYYSCFISYSSRDHRVAERLHSDLQANGVRCWFAPEDMKIGEKIRPTLDQSVWTHDKLLIVLSKNAIGSDWVEQEVETALARERQEKHTVLFPIRLDDTVMEIDVGWPALIRNTRHIGDFRNWKDHDAYQQAFSRLLRDLKAEEQETP